MFDCIVVKQNMCDGITVTHKMCGCVTVTHKICDCITMTHKMCHYITVTHKMCNCIMVTHKICYCITVTHKIHHNDPKLVTPKKHIHSSPSPKYHSVLSLKAWHMSWLSFLLKNCHYLGNMTNTQTHSITYCVAAILNEMFETVLWMQFQFIFQFHQQYPHHLYKLI